MEELKEQRLLKLIDPTLKFSTWLTLAVTTDNICNVLSTHLMGLASCSPRREALLLVSIADRKTRARGKTMT